MSRVGGGSSLHTQTRGGLGAAHLGTGVGSTGQGTPATLTTTMTVDPAFQPIVTNNDRIGSRA